jgi:hypothetical protein
MDRERSINNLADNRIMLRRRFNHLGVKREQSIGTNQQQKSTSGRQSATL